MAAGRASATPALRGVGRRRRGVGEGCAGAARGLVEAGLAVVVELGPWDPRGRAAAARVLAGLPVYVVRVRCDLATLEDRERRRAGPTPGYSRPPVGRAAGGAFRLRRHDRRHHTRRSRQGSVGVARHWPNARRPCQVGRLLIVGDVPMPRQAILTEWTRRRTVSPQRLRRSGFV